MDLLSLLIGFVVGLFLMAVGAFFYVRQLSRARAEEVAAQSQRAEQARNELTTLQVEAARLEVQAAQAEKLEADIERLQQHIDELNEEINHFQNQQTRLETERANLELRIEENKQVLAEAEKKFREAFESLSSDALRRNNSTFLELAKEALKEDQAKVQGDLEKRQQSIELMLKPLGEKLGEITKHVNEMEEKRQLAYGEIGKSIESMLKGAESLRSETKNLVHALKTPVRRGQWGEFQLRRVAEMAGMLNYCDFDEQVNVQGEDGNLRPDMVVRMPGHKNIVVDAKAALDAYLQAIETSDEEQRRVHFVNHARQVRDHVVKLSGKKYQGQFEKSPDFVVLFLPGEPIFSAALEHDAGLIEFAADKNVLFATPTTLIALLRAVAYGWRQVNLEKDAEEIAKLGKELYQSITTMGAHLARCGKNLSNAVDSYNQMIGSLERNVLPKARRMRELPGFAVVGELPDSVQIDASARSLSASEIPTLPGLIDD